MIFKIFIFLVFVQSLELKSQIVVDPGEMIAIKTASCPDIKNKTKRNRTTNLLFQ